MQSKVKDYGDMYQPICTDKATIKSLTSRAFKFLIVGLAALFILPPVGAQAAPSWLDSEQISWSFFNNDNPQISVGGIGNATAAWEEHGGTVTEIRAATRQAGGTWNINFLSLNGYKASDPQIATNLAGDAVMVWEMEIKTGDKTKSVIRASRKKVNGGWTTPETISYSDQSTTDPDVVIDGYGNAYAVWRQYAPSFTIPPSPGKVRAAKMSSDATWSSPVTLDIAVADDPRLGVDHSGNAVVVWRSSDAESSGDAVRSSTKHAGKPWGDVETISASTDADISSHQIAVNSTGKVDVVWSANGKIYSRLKQVSGSWSTLKTLSNEPNTSSQPQISSTHSGKAVAAWLQISSSGKKRATAAVKAAGSSSWGGPITLSYSGLSVKQVRPIVSATGVPIVVWQESDYSNLRIEGTRRDEDSGLWWQPKSISPEGVDAADPQLSGDSFGNVAAIWTQDGDSGKTVIDTATFDATGPSKLNVKVPTTGVVGEELEFSVNPFDLWSPILKVLWTPEYGVEKTGKTVNHTYSKVGTYTVNVTAYDASFNGTSATRNIKIEAKDEPSAGEEGGGPDGGDGPDGDAPGGDGPNPAGDEPAGPLSGGNDGSNSGSTSQPKNVINPPIVNLSDVLGIAGVRNLSGGDFKNACNFRITSPRVGKTKYKTVKIARKKSKSKKSAYILRLSSKKVKRIISGHGIKGTMKPGMVKGKKVVCRNVRMALLHKKGRHYSPPGLTGKRYRISSRRFKSRSFAKRVVKRLTKRFGIGKLRTKTEADGTLRISFKNYAAKSKQRLSRKANRDIRKKGVRGNTYYLKYSVDISGVKVSKQLKIKVTG